MKVPTVLDGPDRKTAGIIAIVSVLVVWACVVVALALGLGWRLFLFVASGG